MACDILEAKAHLSNRRNREIFINVLQDINEPLYTRTQGKK